MEMHEVLGSTEPVVLLMNHGETLAADIKKALDGASKQGLKVIQVNVDKEPEYAEQFSIGKHPVMAVWHCGEILWRRSRPWKTDVDFILKSALELVPKDVVAPVADEELAEADFEVPTKPITVTDADFMEKVINSPLPVVVDFWAEWCGPCRMVGPILEKLAAEFSGQVVVAKVDVDANPMLSQQFRIQSIPTLMFVKNGKIVGQSAGAAPEAAMRDVMNQLIALEV